MEQDKPLTRREAYEKSVRDFEAVQNEPKKTDMKNKYMPGLLDSARRLFNRQPENGTIAHSVHEEKVVSISFVKVCAFLVVGIIGLLVMINSGVDDKNEAEKKFKEREASEMSAKGAVKGNHLMGLPRDYAERADWQIVADAKEAVPEKADTTEEPEEKLELEYKEPDLPVNEVRIHDTYAEREWQYEEELRLKAKESPIGFEIKEGR